MQKKLVLAQSRRCFQGTSQEHLNTKNTILLRAENAGQDKMPLELPNVANLTPELGSRSAQGSTLTLSTKEALKCAHLFDGWIKHSIHSAY